MSRRGQGLARVLAAVLAAAALPAARGQSPPSAIRSVADGRPRIPDEHDRPYFRQTQSHRGWEIREPQFTVLATTSQADARWAAGQVAEAWSNAARLANRWTQEPKNPDFGLSALQVVIDDEPVRDRDSPLTTVNVLGIQTQVLISVAPGQPRLAEQRVQLREATALAMLYTAGLDSAAPPWALAGIAAFAGRQGLTPEQVQQADARPATGNQGGQQWRFLRQSQDVLAYQRLDQAAARARVQFLLTGHDAEHAPAMLAALRQATEGAARAAAAGGAFRHFPGDSQPAAANTSFDGLIAERQSQFESWQKDPLVGLPVYEPAAALSPELAAAEAEMLVLLKLHRRLAGSPAAKPRERGMARTKIVMLDPAQKTAADAGRVTATETFDAFAARLADPAQPTWATLDVDGRLLLSTDTLRVSELLALAERRYSLAAQDGAAVLVRKFHGNRSLRGWLEENPKHKSRPLAKFEVAGKAPMTKHQ
jgi:hypothetical protein